MSTIAVRHDAVPLRAVRTVEGYLRDSPTIARTGVQTYRMGDRLVREYKGPEVYDAVALAAIQGLPLIDTHAAAITSANVREHIIGTVLSPGRLDGARVAADVIVYDEAPVKAGRKELSLAYAVTVDETPGVAPDGSPYDQRVTAIRRFDHLATVERGRAGIARLRVDSAGDAISADLAHDDPPPSPATPEDQRMSEATMPVRLDGNVTYQVPPAVAAALDALRADAAQAATQTATRIAALEGERDAERARADAAEARIPQAVADATAAARARVALEGVARQHGVEVRADASDNDIRAAVITKLAPGADLAGKPQAYVEARFDMAVADAAQRAANGAAQAAQAAPAPVRADAASASPRITSAEAARAAMIRRSA